MAANREFYMALTDYNLYKTQWLQERDQTGDELWDFFEKNGFQEWSELAESKYREL